jgi:hypothetical protein
MSSTSITEIFDLLISYIAYEGENPFYSTTSYTYSSYTSTQFLNFAMVANKVLSFTMQGLAGFIISNNGSGVSFQANQISGNFQFQINPSLTYLNYQFFMMAKPFSDCFYC